MAGSAGKIVPLDRLVAAIRPGERVFVPGVSAEPVAFVEGLAADPERSRDLELWTSAVPGFNAVPVDRLHPGARTTGIFMQPALRTAQREGRFRLLPLRYSGFVRYIRDSLVPDTCIVQVAPPDAEGRCSLGPAVEFVELAREKSRRTLALINARTPRIPGAPSIRLDEIDLAAEVDVPVAAYEVGAPSTAATAIARRIAAFIPDGAAVQMGLGKVPDAIFGLLHDRRNLRLHSGMLSEAALDLAEAGALDPDFRHVSTLWAGNAGLYERLRDRPGFAVVSCGYTHDIREIAAIDGFVAFNSALSVDLLCQANLEHAEGRAVSGIGGAADFAVGARLSRGGLSVVALPAAFGRGAEARSRIVPRLDDGVASLARTDIDLVVTEHGVADFRGLSVHERAEALIEVAAPDFRSELTDAWREIQARL